jgi:tetratricopeptide (TPR) repeat protein
MKILAAALAIAAIGLAGNAAADPVKRSEAAEALAQQGKFKEAVDEAKLALAEAEAAKDDLAIAQASGTLGGAMVGMGDLSGSEPLLRRAWAIRRDRFGPDAEATLKAVIDWVTWLSINGRDADAEPLIGHAADVMEARAKTETQVLDAAEARATHAMTLLSTGRWVQGETEMLKALAVLSPHEDVKAVQILSFNTFLSSTYVSWGRYDDAMKRAQITLALREKLQGKEHPHLIGVLYILGQLEIYLGDTAAAETYYRRAVALAEKANFKDGPFLAHALMGLANLYVSTGRPDLALALYQRIIDSYSAGADVTWRVADAYRMAAMSLVAENRTAEARPYAEKAVEVYAKALGKADERVGTAHLALARIQYALGHNAEGEAEARAGLQVYKGGLTADNPRVAEAYRLIAKGAALRGDWAEAAKLNGTAVAMMDGRWPGHNPALILARADFARDLLGMGREDARAYQIARLAADPMRERAVAKARLLGRGGAPGLTPEEREVFLTAVEAAWAAAHPAGS